MSAPHVCGGVALLISGLLKNNIDYSPYSIKRALWNTATRLAHVDKFAQGITNIIENVMIDRDVC